MSDRGLFIVFEGGDGTGKTTQSQLLAARLREKGFFVLITREPGGTAVGDRIRDILLHHRDDLLPMAEAFLFAASRAQHVAQVIEPALAKGQAVICDRFLGSTIAYQGAGLGLGLKDIQTINALATSGLEPDLTIVLDLPVDVALARKREEKDPLIPTTLKGPDSIEARNIDFHERVRRGYLSLQAYTRKSVVIIDGGPSSQAVHQEVMLAVERALDGRTNNA